MNQQSANHTDSRTPKAVGSRRVMRGGRTRTEREIAPHLPPDRYHRPAVHTQSVSNIPTTLFGGTTKTTFRLESSAIHRCKELFIKFTAGVSSARTLPPVWEWISKIQVRAQAGSQTLCDLHSDEIALRVAAKYTPEQLASYSALFHCNSDLSAITSNVATGDKHYYLPIIGLFDDVILERADDIFFDLTPENMTDGSSVTLTLAAAHFVVLTDHVTNSDAASALALRSSAIHSKRFVEFIPTAVQSQTVTASTPVSPSVELDAFSGRSAGILIVLKDSSGVIAEIPPDSEIDVVSASGRSEFGDGTKSQYSIVAAYHFPELAGFMKTSSGNYRFLIVPFSDSVGKTLQTGSLSGSRVMRSDRSRIEFTPGATWSTGSYSIHVYNLSMKVLTQWKAKFAVQNM